MVRWLHLGRPAGEAAKRPRRVWFSRLAAAVGAFVLFGMPLVALAAPEPVEGGDPAPPAQMADDDGGHALFNMTAMAPGERASRCLVVAYEGASATPVALRGSGGGSLDDELGMIVEVGTGGGATDCSGFSGSELYRGTLSGFLGQYGTDTAGLTTWEASNDAPSRTFKFTFALPQDTTAAGKSATADFAWQVDVPVPEPAPEPAAAPTEEPQAPTPAGGPETIEAAQPVEIGANESTTRERPFVIRPKVVAAGAHKAKAADPVPATALGQLEEVVGKLINGVAAVAPPVLKRSVFPATLVAVVIGFIGVQNRIDRNDPKLALAPLNAEPDLTFDQ
jgi:hypothetical protein